MLYMYHAYRQSVPLTYLFDSDFFILVDHLSKYLAIRLSLDAAKGEQSKYLCASDL